MRLILSLFIALSCHVEGAAKYLDLPLEPHLKRARSENRPILLYFHAAWCTYCVILENEVLKTGKADEILKNYIFVGVDVDTEEGKKIDTRYQLSGYPAQVFLNSSGAEYNRYLGYDNVKTQLKLLEDNTDQISFFDKIDARILKAKGKARAALVMEKILKRFDMRNWPECISLIDEHIHKSEMAAHKKKLRKKLIDSCMESGLDNRALGMLLSDFFINQDPAESMSYLPRMREIYTKKKKLTKMLPLYEKAIQRFEDYEFCHEFMMAYSWIAGLYEKELDKALNYALKGIAAKKLDSMKIDPEKGNPKSVYAYTNLAELYLARQEWDLAEKSNLIALNDPYTKQNSSYMEECKYRVERIKSARKGKILPREPKP